MPATDNHVILADLDKIAARDAVYNRNWVMIEPLLVVYAASLIKDYIDKRSSRLRDPA